jgi:hypothetical protein
MTTMQWTWRTKLDVQVPSLTRLTRIRCASILLLMTFLGPGVPADAQLPSRQIVVRFLNMGSRKPIRNYPVTVTQWNSAAEDSPPFAKDVASSLSARTDKRGVVVVRLTDPPAKSVSVVCFDLAGGGTGRIDLGEVVKSGVALKFDEKARSWKSKSTERPGEILILTRKLTLWERIRRELP